MIVQKNRVTLIQREPLIEEREDEEGDGGDVDKC